MTSQHALYALAAVLVLVGLVGIVVPVLPGGVLVFAGVVVLAWADGFARIGWPSLTLCALLLAAMWACDWAATALGARRVGASSWGVVGAFVGLLAGLAFGLPGVLLGPFAGGALFEYLRGRDARRAVRVGGGAVLGFLLGAVAKYALAFAMLGVALVAWVW